MESERERIEDEVRPILESFARQMAHGDLERASKTVDGLIDLILEHRAQEAEHCTVNFNATNAGPGLRRARELRALKGAPERSK